jgi:hypothetical protein
METNKWLQERLNFEQEQLKSERQRIVQLMAELEYEKGHRVALQKQTEVEKRRIKESLEVQTKVGCLITVRTVGFAGSIMKDELSRLTPAMLNQLKSVKETFIKHFPVKKMEYVMNDRLYKQFDETRQEFKRLGRASNEVLLFHGTNPRNVKSYVQEETNLILGF